MMYLVSTLSVFSVRLLCDAFLLVVVDVLINFGVKTFIRR